MKKILTVIVLVLVSTALFVSVTLLNKSSQDTTSSIIQSSDNVINSSSDINHYPDPTSSVAFYYSSEEASSNETSSVAVSSEISSAAASSSETSSETSSENVSSIPASSEEVSSQITSSETTSSDVPTQSTPTGEVRAIWISYLELDTMLKGKTKSQFISNFTTACKNVSDYGLNTVIVHVRPFSDALYDSSYFPWSHIITGTQGRDPGFDPLEEMVKIAHNHSLRLEAWINPYRVTTGISLSVDNPAYKWSGSDMVVTVGGGKYYNPAYEQVQELIVNGVREIVENYDVDGIHFDDYFYPTTDESFDKTAYTNYKNNGGTLSLGDFRRQNVTDLVRKVYTAVKSIDSSVTFGISPQGNNKTNYESQYVDVQTIITKGYIDYICPQIYYGYNHSTCPYEATVKEFNSYVKGTNVKLYIGLAAYKIGYTDKWAGNGKDEWLNTTDILKRQVLSARQYSGYNGFSIYTYSSIFTPDASVKNQMQTESENLKSILK